MNEQSEKLACNCSRRRKSRIDPSRRIDSSLSLKSSKWKLPGDDKNPSGPTLRFQQQITGNQREEAIFGAKGLYHPLQGVYIESKHDGESVFALFCGSFFRPHLILLTHL